MADPDDDLLDEPERKPVEAGIGYLSLIIAGIVAMTLWLVWTYTRG